MKIKHLIVAAVAVVALAGCSQPKDYGWIKVAVDRATVQLLQTAEEIGDTPMIPRSIWAGYDPAMLEKQLEKDFDTFKDSLRKKAAPELLGKRRLAGVYDWTSGFYPGSLWYVYEFTGNEAVKEAAVKFTNLLFPVSHYTQTHDLGFMINCSYGNAHRLMPCDTIPEVLVRTADNLCS
ncbi:MAG: glucuronyl hydrolase, partial [Tidjanibacter sp.]|nr:glucuronyl hydrolase [Tidjanibacter sp.]